MKLILDQGLPRSTAVLLRDSGVDGVHTGELGLATAEDHEILEYARSDDRVVVTLDADFHTLIALSGAAGPSVIRVRVEGLRAEALTLLLQRILKAWTEDLESGCMLTVQSDRIRARRLPLT